MNMTIKELLEILSSRPKIVFAKSARSDLIMLGITIIDAKEIIYNLNYGDYDKGPEYNLDPKFKGFIWIFVKKISRKEIYIKLSIDENNIVCISFHKSRW